MNLKMGVWNFYFLAKLSLFLNGNIRFNLFLNLLFAAFILVPVPKGIKYHKYIEYFRTFISILIALALLWKDSWLPPPLDAYAHILAEGIPSKEFIVSFILRYFVNWEMAALISALIICILIRNWKYLTPLTLALVLISPAYELIEKDEVIEKQTIQEKTFEEVRSLASLQPKEKEVKKIITPPEQEINREAEENERKQSETKEIKVAKQDQERDYPTLEDQKLSNKLESIIKKGSPNDWEPINEKEPQKYADAFFQRETLRRIEFKDIKKGEEKFDIIYLHICSLSWDDLEGTSVDWKTFFKQFHILFTNFNAVTSYSGPSLQRLLTSNCGQRRHLDLYSNVPDDCYLFPSLSLIGYKNYFPANHDGVYGDYALNAKRFGRLDAPIMDPKQYKLTHQQFMFDNSLVYDDYEALENWWKLRLGSKAKRAAAYYNTATLHDGSYWAPKRKDWMQRSREARYNEFIDKLFKDFNKFFTLLKKSGRNVVVVFLPEHGMALRGSKIQIAGLRDIPLPQINTVPVGLKLFGPKFNVSGSKQRIISKPTSYMAITSLLSAMFHKSPFGPQPYDPDYLTKSVIQTDHVYENEGALVVKPDKSYMIFDKRENWTKLPVK